MECRVEQQGDWTWPSEAVPEFPEFRVFKKRTEADTHGLTIYQRAVGRDLTYSLKLRAMVFLSSGWTRNASYGLWRIAPRKKWRTRRRRGLAGVAGEAAETPREATRRARCTQHTCTSGHSRVGTVGSVGSRFSKAARWMPLVALKRAFFPTSRLSIASRGVRV